MIDTPRTDEEEDACRECGLHFVPAEFSRQLERELHAMTLRCQAADRTANAALAAAPEAQPRICYMTCKAHEGMTFTMQVSGWTAPAITVCPICNPPPTMNNGLKE